MNRNTKEKIDISTEFGPDGSTIDENDLYYSCMWGESRLTIYDDLKFVSDIHLPFQFPTCCCFGGLYLDRLLITSASSFHDKGYLKLIKMNNSGIKETKVRIFT